MILQILIFGKTHGKKGNNLKLYRQEWRGRIIRQLGGHALSQEEDRVVASMGTDDCQKAIKKDETENFATDPVYEKLGGYNNKWFKPRHTNYKAWEVDKVGK
jgi:hypothetical protein